MILIFDLDDTLYDEMSFVRSGLKAVAEYGSDAFGWDAEESFNFMCRTLESEGRGKVFDRWLDSHGRLSKARVSECVRLYRHHIPSIELFPSARRAIDHYRGEAPLYLVTDGHKIVQKNKISALGLHDDFRRIFITHRFGIHHAKPSVHCFDLIRRSEDCDWRDMVYVGDNPAKDFVNLNPLGVLTVRVMTGGHRDAVARPGYDALLSISDLDDLEAALSCYLQ